MNTIFFTVISIMMVIAAGLQAYAASELGDKCDPKLETASIIAAVSIFVSFVFNGIWVWSLYERRNEKWIRSNNKASMTRRVSILLWTTAVVVGTVAAGAALGQAELYEDLACEVEHSTELHYVSIVLLILSIALPHAMQKRKDNHKFEDAEGKPLKSLKPLQFI